MPLGCRVCTPISPDHIFARLCCSLSNARHRWQVRSIAQLKPFVLSLWVSDSFPSAGSMQGCARVGNPCAGHRKSGSAHWTGSAEWLQTRAGCMDDHFSVTAAPLCQCVGRCDRVDLSVCGLVSWVLTKLLPDPHLELGTWQPCMLWHMQSPNLLMTFRLHRAAGDSQAQLVAAEQQEQDAVAAHLPQDISWGPLVFEARRFVELRKKTFSGACCHMG